MPKKLTDQKYCSWCGAQVEYTTKYRSDCPSCDYQDYISYKPCVNVIISNGSGLLMLKRAIEPRKGLLDFPGGFMDMSDSSIEETAYREVCEEIGIERDAIQNLSYISSAVSPYIWKGVELQNVCFYFTCLIDEATTIKLDQTENSEFNWVTETDLTNIDFAWEIDKRMLTKYYNQKG